MDIDLSGPPDLTTLHSAVVKLVQGHQDHERRILESERVRSELQGASAGWRRRRAHAAGVHVLLRLARLDHEAHEPAASLLACITYD